MKISSLKFNARLLFPTFFFAAASAAFLSSCAMSPQALNSDSVFKFNVLCYTKPVPANDWRIDPAQAVNPDAEGLNIATAIIHDNVDQWLATWEPTDRPVFTPAQRAEWVSQYASFKNGHASVLGRVVAGGEYVLEVSVTKADNQSEKLRFPIKRVDGVWYQTTMDANSEYLHWENSPNKVVQTMNAQALEQYLSGVKASAVAQHSAE